MKLTTFFSFDSNVSNETLAARIAWQKASQDMALKLSVYNYQDVRQQMLKGFQNGDVTDVELFDVLTMTQVCKLYQPDCPARVVIELPMTAALAEKIASVSHVVPSFAGAALVTVKRRDHSSFERTQLPTHVDLEMMAVNGGVAVLDDVPLKDFSSWKAFYLLVEHLLPKAHEAGPDVYEDNASSVYAGAIAAVSLAVQQHMGRPF